MTSPTAVARSVARDAERRARTALDDVLAAHTALQDADTALTAATQAKANAGPALARAVAAARDVGITEAHLAELGITAPSARTLRRHRPRTTPGGAQWGQGRDPLDPADHVDPTEEGPIPGTEGIHQRYPAAPTCAPPGRTKDEHLFCLHIETK